jgi:hypothetical protein
MANHRRDVHQTVAIIVRQQLQRAFRDRAHAALLAQLADGCPHRRFPRLALASRELPQPAQVRVGVPLGDQPVLIAVNQGQRDLQNRLGHFGNSRFFNVGLPGRPQVVKRAVWLARRVVFAPRRPRGTLATECRSPGRH